MEFAAVVVAVAAAVVVVVYTTEQCLEPIYIPRALSAETFQHGDQFYFVEPVLATPNAREKWREDWEQMKWNGSGRLQLKLY